VLLLFQVILLVFDITNPVSFDSLEEWLDTIRRALVSQEHQPMISVVANKCKSYLRT
jgi:GTPase SAR1 family protein